MRREKSVNRAPHIDSLRARPSMWFNHHMYSLVASLGRIVDKLWSTILTVSVMAVALALPFGLWLMLSNIAQFSGGVQVSREISMFLKSDIDVESAKNLAQSLRMHDAIIKVEMRTPEQGLEQLRANGLGEVIDALAIETMEENPLPSILIVTPKSDASVVEMLQGLAEVELVQHDAQWRQRLDNWLRFGDRMTLVLGLLIGWGALLVVGNTMRLDIQSRRNEIEILQYLGASDGFIRRPFLYLGAWYGTLSGGLAMLLLTVAMIALRAPLDKLSGSYGNSFVLSGLETDMIITVVIVSGVFGLFVAGLVTNHYLRSTRSVGL